MDHDVHRNDVFFIKKKKINLRPHKKEITWKLERGR